MVAIDLGGSPTPCAVAPSQRTRPCARTIELLIQEKLQRNPDSPVCVGFFHGGIPDDQQLAACDGRPIKLSVNPADLSRADAERLIGAGVEAIDLELMTFSPHTLRTCRRGYTVQRVQAMATRLKEMGFKLGLHLVPGLPGSDVSDALRDAVIAATTEWVDYVRVWPALGFQGTLLSQWAETGRWRPWDTRQAIDVIDKMLETLDEAQIPVVRIGIQPGQDIPVKATAGPIHPNLRGEIMSRRLGRQMRLALANVERGSRPAIAVNPRDLSAAKGTSNVNIRACEKLFDISGLDIHEDEQVARGTVDLRQQT